MKIAIATRSRSELLYHRASSFWPDAAQVPRHRITGMDHWRDAIHYLHALLDIDADVVVNCDEDCFVMDWGVVERVCEAVMGPGLVMAGMPDVLEHCHHRNNAPFVHNPFFNVLRPAPIKAMLAGHPTYANQVLLNVNPPGCRFHEPFNAFFRVLFDHAAGTVPLDGRDHADGMSTWLSHAGVPFALHTWYSRQYEHDAVHRDRIDARFAEAMHLRVHYT